ncbi:MAG: tetratricopeptide repeat protein [Candidatus Omnitrophota bacterium]
MDFFRKDSFKTGWLIAIVIALTFTAYSFILGASFRQIDDRGCIVDNADIRSFSNIGKIFKKGFFEIDHSYYRPLVHLSFMTEYHFFGLNPLPYYLNNIFLHIANALIVFFLFRYFFKDLVIAFFVSLLFAIHPIQWESVSNVAGRSSLLCSFFYLSAFFSFCLFLDRKKIALYVLSLLLFALALLCKEIAAVLPFLVVSYIFFLADRSKKTFRELLQWALPFFIILALYFLLRQMLGITEIFRVPKGQEVFAFTTFLRSVITHLRLFLFPVDLYFLRSKELFTDFVNIEFLLTLAFFFVVGFVVFRYWRRMPNYFKFFLCWFWIELLPVSQIIGGVGPQPGYIATFEHFLYVPSIAIFASLVFLFKNIIPKTVDLKIISKSSWIVIISGLLMFFFLITIKQNIYVKDEIRMLKESIRYNPNSFQIQQNLGIIHARKGLFKDAGDYFKNSLEINPDSVVSRIALGKALCDQGLYWDGIGEYEKIQNAGPEADLLKKNLRATYEFLARRYKQDIEKDPENPKLYYSLGVVYSKTEKMPEAIEEYKRSVALDPNFKNALFNLGTGYAILGKFDDAAFWLEKAVSLKTEPKEDLDYQAFSYLSLIYEKLGQPQKSEAALKESIRPGLALPETQNGRSQEK